MIKNEYRRGLVMLRPIVQGFSGHVRLERRTLTGSMYFIVNLPDVPGDMYAVLSGRNAREYYAAKLGTLRRDGRGQATLAYSFDPRNIDGRTLEDYIFVVVAKVEGCACEIVLSGNVNGSQEADFCMVERSVCEAVTDASCPAADIPGKEEDDAVVRLCMPGLSEDEAYRREGEDAGAENAEGDMTQEMPSGKPEEEVFGDAYGSVGVFARENTTAFRSAADTAGVDASVTWPSAIEGIRQYFAQQEAERSDLDDDFVYVRAPMPEGSGFPYVLIGIEADDGRIESVRFVLPGRFAESPPAGLDGYVWMGGPVEGWWVLTVDPRTGNPVEFDD